MKVLVVDDEQHVCELVRRTLAAEGFDVTVAVGGEAALEAGRRQVFDLIFSDVMMDGTDGLDVLRAFKEELAPAADIVLMTGSASLETALTAIRSGAHDFILKPFKLDDLVALARGAEKRRRCTDDPPVASSETGLEATDIIGASAPMFEVFKTLGRIASTNLPVLIAGESGTGKEVIARAIHSNSSRSSGPFVAVNCGALTESLLETELFGHVKGAFTGAGGDRLGLFEEASGGTLLLDEITETSPAFQVKLLRVLQENEVCRVGSNRPTRVNVRVLATTNRDPDALAASGLFRSDLLFRLNVVSIRMPPLRERGGDIDLMISAFLKQYRPVDGEPVRLTAAACERLRLYSWPGNVRELRHTMQRLAILYAGRIVDTADLPEKIRKSQALLDAVVGPERDAEARSGLAGGTSARQQAGASESDLVSLDELERRYLIRVLYVTEGNFKRAAEILDVDRKTLARMVDRFAIDANRIRDDAKSPNRLR